MGIRTRYTLAILALLVLAVSAVTAVSLVQVRSLTNEFRASSTTEMTTAVRRSLRDNGVATARMLAGLLATPLYHFELEPVGDLAARVLRHPDVIEVLILDTEATVVHDGTSHIDRYGERITDDAVRAALTGYREIWFVGDTLRVAQPVNVGDQVVGVILLTLSTSAARAELHRLDQSLTTLSSKSVNDFLTVLGFALAILTIAAIWLADYVALGLVRPIHQLRNMARFIGTGSFPDRAPFSRQDEIGELAEALIRMGADIKAGQDRLIQARDEATRASRAKTEFLANVSHELRTPLNAIIGFSDILDRGMFGPLGDERYAGYANDILFSGQHLLSVINAILDYSKAEANKLDIHRGEASLSDIVNGVMLLVGPLADKGGVEILADVGPDVPTLRCDEAKLRQALLNIVANAVKFTPAGGKVAVSADLTDDSVTIRVSDTGIGISKADIKKALAPFGQVDGSLSRRHDGTGLGLPLAKKFMELHGGSLTIDSELGVGTTVILELPLVAAVRLARPQSELPTQSKISAA